MGADIAGRLLSEGYVVYAAARRPERLAGKGAKVMVLHATDAAQCVAAVARVVAEQGPSARAAQEMLHCPSNGMGSGNEALFAFAGVQPASRKAITGRSSIFSVSALAGTGPRSNRARRESGRASTPRMMACTIGPSLRRRWP